MGYADLPDPEPLRSRVRALLPSYASLSLTAGAREAPAVTRSPGFRTALGETVSPPTTQLRVGPVILTLVWGRGMTRHESVGEEDDEGI